jgi:hypothetical protein
MLDARTLTKDKYYSFIHSFIHLYWLGKSTTNPDCGVLGVGIHLKLFWKANTTNMETLLQYCQCATVLVHEACLQSVRSRLFCAGGLSSDRLRNFTASPKARVLCFGRFIMVSRLAHPLVNATSDISVLCWLRPKWITLTPIHNAPASNFDCTKVRHMAEVPFEHIQRNYSPWRQLSPVSFREVR